MAAVALVLCVYLLSVASQGVVGDKVYTVVANQSASSCLSDNKTECSLMYYAAHPDQYFREDNTTFHFLPGQHELVDSTLVLMANISNLALYGTDVHEVTVVCSGEDSGGFSFYNVTNLTLKNLGLWNCSKRHRWLYDSVAVYIQQTVDVKMNRINIQNTPGLGLSLKNLYGNISINNITVDYSHNTKMSKGINFVYYCSYPYENSLLVNNMKISDSFFRHGINNFDSVAPSSGITVGLLCSANVSIVFDNVVVSGNQGKNGGNVFIEFTGWSTLWSISVSFLNSKILNGTANSGGGICVFAIAGGVNSGHSTLRSSTTILNVENTHFEGNTAYHNGGAVYLRLTQNSQRDIGRIVFKNNCTFKRNQLVYHSHLHGGIAVYILTFLLPSYDNHGTIFFEIEFSNCKFLENSVAQHSAAVPRTGALYAECASSITLRNCTFINNTCSGIVGIYSNFLLHGENEVSGNSAYKGGGLFFCSFSMMHLHNGTVLNIVNNHATLSGGGIYVDGECSPAVEFCLFQVDNVTADNATLQQTQVRLINNTAVSGSALYGGLIDWCILYVKRGQKFSTSYPAKIFNNTFHITTAKHDLSAISSNPIYVRFCELNSSTTKLDLINCPLSTNVVVKPGQTFSLSAVIMGQHYGLVPGVVVAYCVNESFSIAPREYSQYINARNTSHRNLTYSVFTKEKVHNLSLRLVAEDYYFGFPTFQYQPSYINITVEECPLGFIEDDDRCSCFAHIPCNITKQTVFRSNPQWIGYKNGCCSTNTTTSIISHSFCPLGYCFDKSVYIHATVNHFYQDVQCAKHRTGLLCGKCKQNYSLGFGSSQCLAGCSTPHRYVRYLRVIGLTAVCAVAGILLVVLLTLLNLTVAEGTLNGLIFYANIVQVNQDLFFPSDTHARPWTAFIAWLNLDFGVTVCFYDGMDAYVKTWLQFIFPLYIWIISGGIVYFSRKSRRISKLAGKNSVKVLATLFLLSFGKLIRTIIAVGFFTNVKSHDGKVNISVWLLDANVHYLHGKHITLFVVACLAGGVALLYALILTFIQCLRRAPNSRMCGWIQRLKPLLDAYTGPYKNKYHFWTGFLLLVRFALFTSFAVNFKDDPTLNFTLIIVVCAVLLVAIQPGIYRNKLVGYLESLMYLNLILFSATMMFTLDKYTQHRDIAPFVFGGLALVKCLGIVAYHAHKQWAGPLKSGSLCQDPLWQGRRGRMVIQPVLIQKRDSDDSSEEEEEKSGENDLSNGTWPNPNYREPLIVNESV